jgi:hypothetical protein
VAGILGMPLFGSHVVELDYPGLRGRILNATEPPPSATVIPVTMRSGPVIDARAKLAGRPEYRITVQVDTGSAHILTFTYPFVDSRELLEAAESAQRGETLGLGGSSEDMSGYIESFSVGPFVVNHPQVRFSGSPYGTLATSDFEGNLGGGFLKDFRVTFDLPRGRLWLERLVGLVPGVARD